MMQKWKKWLAALCAAVLLMSWMPGGVPALAEEDGEMSEEDSQELAAAEGEDTEDEESAVADPSAVYHEKTLADFDVNSPALYRGRITDVIGAYSIYSDKSINSPKVVKGIKNVPVDILYVGLVWVIVRYEGKLRRWIPSIRPPFRFRNTSISLRWRRNAMSARP